MTVCCPGLRPAAPYPLSVHSGDPRADMQAALAALGPQWGFKPVLDISDEQARDDLAQASVMALSFVAQSARGFGQAAGATGGDRHGELDRRALSAALAGRGRSAHVAAIDAYWTAAAEHGMSSSTFTARVIASTGADVAAALSAAVGALSGPLHGGAPARVLQMLDEVEAAGDASKWVRPSSIEASASWGSATACTAPKIHAPGSCGGSCTSSARSGSRSPRRWNIAALEELQARRPDRILATNIEFWAAVVLDFAEVPPVLYTPMFGCARVAGWSAHILEQKREGRMIRPSAKYVGAGPRPLSSLER